MNKNVRLILIILIVILALFGAGLTGYGFGIKDEQVENKGNIDSNDITSKDMVVLKYEGMKEKLIEYGKLFYENEEYLNDNSKEVFYFKNLNDLSLEKGYDISMFIDPLSGKQCDLELSGIQFIIRDVSNLDNIIYDFNPLLVCGEKSNELAYGDLKNDLDEKLYEYMFDYLPKIYDKDSIVVEPFTYKATLKEFQQKGYDISMFKNADTGKQCDLEETYIQVDVLVSEDGQRGYSYRMYVSCDN